MLPELNIQTYTETLPVSKQEIRFRPYLMKEQKILLMAVESKEPKALVDAILQILNNCLITKIELSSLPQVDVEYYFYVLRARSQAETVSTKYRCNNLVEDQPCGNIMDHEFNLLSDLEFENLDVDPVIQLTDKVGIKLMVPRFDVQTLQQDYENLTVDNVIDEIVKNIDFIFDEDNTYKIDESNIEEVKVFLDQLSTEQFKQIDDFFTKLPRIVKNLNITCGKCGYEHKILVEDIFDFFS